MDEIKLDPGVVGSLSKLYAEVYEIERTGGATAVQASERATEAVGVVVGGAKPTVLLPVTEQATDKP